MHPIKYEAVEKYLPVATTITLTPSRLDPHALATLSQADKVLITKLVRNLNLLCKMGRKEVVEFVKSNPAYQPALSELYFDQPLNNWRALTSDPHPHLPLITG